MEAFRASSFLLILVLPPPVRPAVPRVEGAPDADGKDCFGRRALDRKTSLRAGHRGRRKDRECPRTEEDPHEFSVDPLETIVLIVPN